MLQFGFEGDEGPGEREVVGKDLLYFCGGGEQGWVGCLGGVYEGGLEGGCFEDGFEVWYSIRPSVSMSFRLRKRGEASKIATDVCGD